MNSLKTIEALIYDLDAAIKRTEKRLKTAPAGNIVLRTRDNSPLFYIKTEDKEEYLGAGKESQIKALAQKKYDKEILKTFKSEKVALEKLLKSLKGTTRFQSEQQVWADFPEALKKYVSQDISTNEGYIQKWINQTWRLKDNIPDNRFFTIKGDHVRSKSEVIIADRLHHAGIPYHYEMPLPLGPSKFGQNILHPDFTVLNTRTLETFYWEHLGQMDDEKYFTKAKERLEIYADAGYFPGKNLILSFETASSPLNIVYIDLLIKQYLL